MVAGECQVREMQRECLHKIYMNYTNSLQRPLCALNIMIIIHLSYHFYFESVIEAHRCLVSYFKYEFGVIVFLSSTCRVSQASNIYSFALYALSTSMVYIACPDT